MPAFVAHDTLSRMLPAAASRGGRPRVLHLAKFYPPEPGGMERVLQLACESTESHVENFVLAAHTERWTVHERVRGIQVTRAGRLMRVGSVPVCPSFPFHLRRSRADIAVLHEPNAPALVADLFAGSQRPLIVWYHADLVRPSWIYHTVYRPLLQRVLRRAARIIVASPAVVANAEGLRDVRAKCVVVPYGIDVGAMRRRTTAPAWLRSFRASHDGPMALMVGRMVPYKGVDVLLRALVGTNVSAVIIGSGRELERNRALAVELGLGHAVLFPGTVPDDELAAAYQACDFFVLPSVTRQEAFGVVQLEAMACGKAVISTDLPTGVPWVNQHGVSGIVVPPGDVDALRDGVRRLAGDRDLRDSLGRGGRDRVSAEFSLDRVRERILAVYRQAVRGEVAAGEASTAYTSAAAEGQRS